MSTRAAAVATLFALAACAPDDPQRDAALASFARFRSAVQTADQDALCDLLTRESLPAIASLASGGAAGVPVAVDTVERRHPGRYDLIVQEAGGPAGVFVVVKEAGAWRVDLVESAVATHGVVDGAPTIEPAGLTAGQIDRIRSNHGIEVP